MRMSVSPKINHCILSTNPNNYAPNRTTTLLYSDLVETCALKIQRLKQNSDIQHSAKMMKATMRNQAYRASLIKHFSLYIAADNCELLLRGSEDPETLASYSTYDKSHVTTKTRHVVDALAALFSATVNETPINWLQCCEIAIEKNYNVIKRARTVADWYQECHTTPKLQFSRSKRGRESFFQKSPFSEDECLTLQFKSWARQDLEHLNVKKAAEFINTRLLSSWSVQQLNTNKISYPVTEFVVARWIREIGFKYEKHKKCYYVDRHEDEDVVEDRKTYLSKFFANEIFEHCWIQLRKAEYDSLKRRNPLRTLNVKKEHKSDLSEDIAVKTQKYIEEFRTHFYTEGEERREMVEIHVDDYYAYDDKDNNENVPNIGPLGDNLSVRLPHGKKARLCFGQDEAIFRSSQ